MIGVIIDLANQMGVINMFKQMLKRFDKMNYILIIKNGVCQLVDRYTQQVYLTFSNDKTANEKEKILNDYYNELTTE